MASSGSARFATGRVRQIRLLTEANSTLLIAQFLLGMWTNLFTSFPNAAASANPFVQIFTNGLYVLAAHFIVGLALFGVAVAILVLSALARIKRLIITAGVGLVSIGIAGVSALIFVLSQFQDNTFSFLMALGFILAIGTYSRAFIQASTSASP